MPKSMVNILDITIHIECQNQEATSLPLCLSDFLYSIHASIHMHTDTHSIMTAKVKRKTEDHSYHHISQLTHSYNK